MTATWQPALLTGPFDWDPAETPVRAFQERVARALALADADGLLVCGDRAEFGALAWLTGFVAKLGPALASFTPDGVESLWFSGGPGMAASARKLTWIDNVRALGAPARDFSALAGQRIALWGEAVMPASLFAAITAVPVELVPMDVELDGLRRCKSSGELVLLRRASGILQSVAELLRDELRCGTRLGGAVLAAERHVGIAGDVSCGAAIRTLLGAGVVRDGHRVIPAGRIVGVAAWHDGAWRGLRHWLVARRGAVCGGLPGRGRRDLPARPGRLGDGGGGKRRCHAAGVNGNRRAGLQSRAGNR